MLKQLKFKNQEIPGYFIDENGKIYDENGVEQKQKLYPSEQYFYFKRYKVHWLIAHSFLGYKPGLSIHHKNEIKTDNRLENLVYLTRGEHTKLHKTGMKHSEQSKAKNIASQKRKPVYCLELDRVFESVRGAARELSLHRQNIISCCQGKQKKTGGYHFKYFN